LIAYIGARRAQRSSGQEARLNRKGKVAILVGVPKEIKDHECRVGLIPATARELAIRGHHVIVETGAGIGTGFGDDE
jgi:hypothetical protein